jgi:hypothetical protein
MSLLTRLPEILEKAREEYETAGSRSYDIVEIVGHDVGSDAGTRMPATCWFLERIFSS